MHGAAEGFLAAFDSLQFDAFRGYFAEEMMMFFPFPQFPGRVGGRAEVEDIFGKFMTAQREARAKAGRPMVQGITPPDLRVQMASPDVAVVTFHLGAEDTPFQALRRVPEGTGRLEGDPLACVVSAAGAEPLRPIPAPRGRAGPDSPAGRR